MRESLQRAAIERRIEWRQHVLERMVSRGVSRDAVISALTAGEVVEDYPNGYPFPSCLLMTLWEDRPLHVVAAYDCANETAYIVTVYEPDTTHFGPDLRTRRQNDGRSN